MDRYMVGAGWGIFRVSISIRELVAILRTGEGQGGRSGASEMGQNCARHKHSEESEEKRETNQCRSLIFHSMDLLWIKASYGNLSNNSAHLLARWENVLLDIPLAYNMLQTCREKYFHSFLSCHHGGYGTDGRKGQGTSQEQALDWALKTHFLT